MKKLVWLSVAAICSASCFAEELVAKDAIPPVSANKFAVVDLEKVVGSDIKSIESNRNEQMKKVQVELQKEQAAIQSALAKYQKNAPTMSKEQKESMEKDISEQYNGLLHKRNKLVNQVESSIKDRMNVTLGRFNDAVARVAQKNGCDVVVRSDTLSYFNPKFNITKLVQQEYNKHQSGQSSKTGQGTAAAAAKK